LKIINRHKLDAKEGGIAAELSQRRGNHLLHKQKRRPGLLRTGVDDASYLLSSEITG
jgi:hypothetical protein